MRVMKNVMKWLSLLMVLTLFLSACTVKEDHDETSKAPANANEIDSPSEFVQDETEPESEPEPETDTGNLAEDTDFNADKNEETQPVMQSRFEDVSGRTKIATTVDEFDSTIGNFVNLEHYDRQTISSNADQISSYKMKRDVYETQNYALDYSLVVEDTTFSLPLTCGELEEAGWDCRDDLESEIESSDRMGVLVSFRNHAGKEFYASVVNRSGATKQLKDCYITEVKFEKYTHDYLEDITILSDTAPFVTVCGDIDSNSSLQDILDQLGEPWMIEFCTDGEANYEPLAYVKLTYRVQTDNEYGCLAIAVAAETDDVMSIDYDHELVH